MNELPARLAPATATAATAAAVAAATTAAFASRRTRARFVHIERATAEAHTVELLDPTISLFIVWHFNKTKPSRTSRVAI